MPPRCGIDAAAYDPPRSSSRAGLRFEGRNRGQQEGGGIGSLNRVAEAAAHVAHEKKRHRLATAEEQFECVHELETDRVFDELSIVQERVHRGSIGIGLVPQDVNRNFRPTWKSHHRGLPVAIPVRDCELWMMIETFGVERASDKQRQIAASAVAAFDPVLGAELHHTPLRATICRSPDLVSQPDRNSGRPKVVARQSPDVAMNDGRDERKGYEHDDGGRKAGRDHAAAFAGWRPAQPEDDRQ